MEINKQQLSERDICTKFITPAIERAGWNKQTQFLEEVTFTDGKIYVKGKLTARGAKKRADYILFYKPNIPLAIIEAKDNIHAVGDGMQQALDYARILDIPFVFSSNGDGFLFHNSFVREGIQEKEISLEEFPSPNALWELYKRNKGITKPEIENVIKEDYYYDGSGRKPRYYQQIAINRTVEAIAKNENRILLVMATGTGKTYVAFQIAHRLWKASAKKRILFLADRNALVDQARRGDFKPFRDKMTVVKNRQVDKAYEVYLALYQGLSGSEEEKNIYKQFSREFFDLVIIDECHRGSAKEDSAWREILDYFSTATHIGLTATPKETYDSSNIEYFGEPLYTYSLKQGIEDGFLAPYRVVRIGLNIDLEGWRPPKGYLDKNDKPVEDRIYNRTDFDRNIVVDERRELVAKKVSEFLKGTNRFDKTIIFCVDIEHSRGMRTALVNCNPDLVADNDKYVMNITGDDEEGKRELDSFTNPEERYPVIATTSKLMTTGIDAQTCKVIVLDSNIQSMTEFKQIIGRGTRVNEDFGKQYFTILDFRNVTDLFADPDFDGEPVRIKPVGQGDDFSTIVEEEEDGKPIIDEITGTEISVGQTPVQYRSNVFSNMVREPRKKIFVNGIDVTVLVEREIHFDHDGKMITKSLKEFTKELVKNKYRTIKDFLNHWTQAERKVVIVEELRKQGVLVEALMEAVENNCDLFDLICHVAYDQPPLTRKERANNVKKRNYFTKYGEPSRKVLEALLDKYADEGIENIESMEVLKVKPLTEFGSPTEIIKEFGSKENYLNAVKELETELYKTA